MADDHDTDRQDREELLAMVAEYGVAVRHVFPAEGDNRIPFAYTVGLTAVGHPEIVVEGLPQESGHAFLNDVADAVHRGERFPAGTIRTDLTLDPAPIVFVRVDDLDGLDAIIDVYPERPRIEAVQLIWTDSRGRLPWHPGHANPLGQQRLRGPVPAAALDLPAPELPAPELPAPEGPPDEDLVTGFLGVVAVSPEVLDGAVVTSVWHTAGGDWWFTTDTEARPVPSRPVVGVGEDHLLALDRSLADVVGLPAGVRATRQAEDRHQWVRWPEAST